MGWSWRAELARLIAGDTASLPVEALSEEEFVGATKDTRAGSGASVLERARPGFGEGASEVARARPRRGLVAVVATLSNWSRGTVCEESRREKREKA